MTPFLCKRCGITLIKCGCAYAGHSDQRWTHVTYAQHGDDIMLVNLFAMLGIERPSYLDIGAHHPTTISNTRLLYERGSRGINVEVNPMLIDAFHVERPEDLNLNIGVGPVAGHLPFYMFSRVSGLNTFAPSEVERLSHMQVQTIVPYPVVTLDWLVQEHCNGIYPHILLLDIEGLDHEVLGSTAFRGWDEKSPYVVVVEVRPADSQSMIELLGHKGYACYCRMGENMFFVRAKLLRQLY